MSFMKELKSTLVAELKSGGPVKAVSVCADTAQKLTAAFGIQNDLEIKRVSSKSRNSLNKPDDFEIKILNKFEELNSSGKIIEATEHVESFETDGVTKIRYMKPIVIQGACLSCHGSDSEVGAEVAQLIKSRYPEDKARNYKIGDLRGAISITQIIDQAH